VAVSGYPAGTVGRIVDERLEVGPPPAGWRRRRKLVNSLSALRLVARHRLRSSRRGSISAANVPKVFVVGCGRSGTSWVQDILAASGEVATTNESHAFETIYVPVTRTGASSPATWSKVLQRYDVGWREQRWTGLYWWVTRQELLDAVRDGLAAGTNDETIALATIRSVLDRAFVSWGDEARVLVEKSPTHIFYAEHILSSYPEATIVEVVRDGRDVCISLEKQGLTLGWPPRRREDQIARWRRSVEAGQALHDDPRWKGRVLRVRYEDLHAQPIDEITRLYRFAGLDVDADEAAQVAEAASINNFADRGDGRHRRKGAVGDWRHGLTEEDLAMIKREAGDLLEAVGYAV
jgi:hypothetical protein